MVRLDLAPLLQGQTRIAKLKSADNSLIFGPRGLGWWLVPSLGHLKSVRDIQRQVDNRLRELEDCSFTP